MVPNSEAPSDPPAAELGAALAEMRFEVLAGSFFLGGTGDLPGPEDLVALGAPPAQVIRESGETTLLAREEHLGGFVQRHPDARVERDLVWIRFELPMGWELVGFLARVTGALADAGVPLGAVCGYSRDHLFVARPHLAAAERVLGRLFPKG